MDTTKKSRIEFLYEQFNDIYEKSFKKDKLITIDSNNFISKLNQSKNIESCYKNYTGYGDISFINYYINKFSNNTAESYLDNKTIKDVIFNYFMVYDPTKNKEYLSWFIKLYGDLCKQRPQITKINKTNTLFSVDDINRERLFFEDFEKVSIALESFSFLKKTNVLSESQKDIFKYDNFNDFISTIKPYITKQDDEDTVNVHTLTHKELNAIQNYVNGIKKPNTPLAELVYENKEWVIVITHNKEANDIFGKHTTWCTAGSRYDEKFEYYNKQGYLFVLIKKGYGSSDKIHKYPNSRQQFHFQTSQFMDADDKSIDIGEFLSSNKGIKEYFSKYIDEVYSNKLFTTDQIISGLTKYGYIDKLIPILKKIKATELILDNTSIDDNILNSIGEIKSLTKLSLVKVGISTIPDGIFMLENLEYLNLSSNKLITSIPPAIKNLKNLKMFYLCNCDILEPFDIGELTKLTELSIDMNKNLKTLPTNIGNCTELVSLTASNCDIENIDDSILNLKQIRIIDFSTNRKINYINPEVSKLKFLAALNISTTRMDNEIIEKLVENGSNKKPKCNVISFNNLPIFI